MRGRHHYHLAVAVTVTITSRRCCVRGRHHYDLNIAAESAAVTSPSLLLCARPSPPSPYHRCCYVRDRHLSPLSLLLGARPSHHHLAVTSAVCAAVTPSSRLSLLLCARPSSPSPRCCCCVRGRHHLAVTARLFAAIYDMTSFGPHNKSVVMHNMVSTLVCTQIECTD